MIETEKSYNFVTIIIVKTDVMHSKILHIVRHGKALQDYQYIQDVDRPLIEKGILNNITIARQLRAQYPAPGLIISSHAARALQTAHIFASVMGYPHARVQVNENLYLDGENETYSILEKLSDELDSVMVVGHNLDLTCVAKRFAECRYPIPTSGVVTIHFETDRWNDVGKAKTKSSSFFEK